MYGLLLGALVTAMAPNGSEVVEGAGPGLQQARAAANECRGEFSLMNPAVPQVAYSDGSDALCISGNIDSSLESAVIREMSVDGRRIDYVVLSGESGEMQPAIRIAERIQGLDATAVVQRRCASLCAQILFVAAPHKVILKEGMVWFPGGPFNPERIRIMSIPVGAKQVLLHDHELFQRFYSDHGLDPRLVNQSPPEAEKDSDRGVLTIRFWSAGELRELGVAGVVHE